MLIHKVAVCATITELWTTYRAISAIFSQAGGIEALVLLEIKPVILGALLAHFGVLLAFVTLLDFAGEVETSVFFKIEVKAFLTGVAFVDT